MKRMLQSAACTRREEARCPNLADCFGRGTVTFMLLATVHARLPLLPRRDRARARSTPPSRARSRRPRASWAYATWC
jgi:hypothetical protein